MASAESTSAPPPDARPPNFPSSVQLSPTRVCHLKHLHGLSFIGLTSPARRRSSVVTSASAILNSCTARPPTSTALKMAGNDETLDPTSNSAPDLQILGDEITLQPGGYLEPENGAEEGKEEALMNQFASFRSEPLQ